MRQGLAKFRGHLAAAVLVVLGVTAFAGIASAASCCGNAPPPLSPQAVSDFENAKNTDLLQTWLNSHDPNKVGGGALTAQIRDLLLSDSNTLPNVISLQSLGNSDQKAAIAAGLAQAAKLWLRGDPSVAQQIQQAVANTNDQPFITAYNVAAGNQPIGATGGGGGSPGGPGGQTGALGGGFFGTGGAEGIGGSGTNTGSFSMTGGVVGSGTVSP